MSRNCTSDIGKTSGDGEDNVEVSRRVRKNQKT